jgi:hypothetical protein
MADSTDPAVLLDRAWALEPPLLLTERRETLERLAEVIDSGAVPAPPPGRDWRLELLAELAVDASTHARIDESLYLVDQVRDAAGAADAQIALARAAWARGRALAWAGTDALASEGARELAAAAEMFAALGRDEWQAWTLIWFGHTVHYENGRPHAATGSIQQGLSQLTADSPWRPTALVFLADTQMEVGELEAAETSLNEALLLADYLADAKSRSYASWSGAHLAAAREDQHTAERLLGEVERDGGEWFDSHLGLYFLADAAALLDGVGLSDRAQRYLQLAQSRGSDQDDYVVLARAVMLARTGDPHLGEAMLQEVVRSEWVEKRLRWRNTLLLAWSKLRAGARADVGVVARRALTQAEECGGVVVAMTAEPLITEALAPLAEEAGSRQARELLMANGQLIVRLFGRTQVTGEGGRLVELPAGLPGELVRMLALHEHGLPVDRVLAILFPEAAPSSGRQRLRQVLSRLRTAAGELVIRDGEILRLLPAWVDLRTFRSLAQRAGATRGSRQSILGQAALALAERGPLLVGDPYAAWAEAAREEVDGILTELRRAGLS